MAARSVCKWALQRRPALHCPSENSGLALRFARSIRTTLLCCLLLVGCAETGGGEGPPGYVVRPHDTLYSIAWRHDLDYRDLARWNNIGPDYRISVGQYLVLRPGPARVRASRRAPPETAPGHAASAVTPRTGAPAPSGSQTPGASTATGVTGQGGSVTRAPTSSQRWIWPTEVEGGPIAVPGGGILLNGRLGQDVRAASAGRVVYAGSGLRGYGNLIIIKHGESLLSAYAHNREMLVRDGQDVAAGQVIAHMGEGRPEEGATAGSARQVGVLYFEIRQNGRPIDPLPFFNSLHSEGIPREK